MEIDTMEPAHIPRVNCSMLNNYVGKQVLIMAELIAIENMQMKIRCSDGPIILVHLQEPVNQNLAQNTKVQVLATPKSKSAVQCNDFIVLQDPANDFDMKLYNETIKRLAELEDSNTYLVSDVEELWGATNEKEISLINAPDPQQDNQNGAPNSQPTQNRNESSFY